MHKRNRLKGKTFAIIFLLIFVSFQALYGQWAITFGESDDEYSSSIQQTVDGGYVFLGNFILSGVGEYASEHYYIRI